MSPCVLHIMHAAGRAHTAMRCLLCPVALLHMLSGADSAPLPRPPPLHTQHHNYTHTCSLLCLPPSPLLTCRPPPPLLPSAATPGPHFCPRGAHQPPHSQRAAAAPAAPQPGGRSVARRQGGCHAHRCGLLAAHSRVSLLWGRVVSCVSRHVGCRTHLTCGWMAQGRRRSPLRTNQTRLSWQLIDSLEDATQHLHSLNHSIYKWMLQKHSVLFHGAPWE